MNSQINLFSFRFKFALLIATLIAALLACTEKPKEKISIRKKHFMTEVVLYPLTADSVTVSSVLNLMNKELQNFTLVKEIPDSIKQDYLMVQPIKDSLLYYTPPNLTSLEYMSEGLSGVEKVKLQSAQRALVITFFGPSENVVEKQKKISSFIAHLVDQREIIVSDNNTYQFFNQASWQLHRLDNFTGNNILDQVTIHTYREGEFCRAVTLGMDKFGLPDISMKDFSCHSQNSHGTLINTVIATLLEQGQINADSTLQLDLNTISDIEMKKAVTYDIKGKAKQRAVIKLRRAVPEQGDNINRQLKITFDDQAYSSAQEEQEELIKTLFGSEDDIIYTDHSNELVEASDRAKKKLPELQLLFNKGLEPGYSILLKAPFKTKDGNEWMWVEVTNWDTEDIEGILQNEPYEIPDLKVGAIVHVKQDDIFDYMLYKPDGSMEGNETGEIIEKENQ